MNHGFILGKLSKLKPMKIKIYGAGTWGTALAELLVQNGHDVTVWHYKHTFLNDLQKSLIHPNLVSHRLSKKIKFTDEIQFQSDVNMIVIATIRIVGTPTNKNHSRSGFPKTTGVMGQAVIALYDRAEGRDWPLVAETMIGFRRLDNLEMCIRKVVNDGVPGDPAEAPADAFFLHPTTYFWRSHWSAPTGGWLTQAITGATLAGQASTFNGP